MYDYLREIQALIQTSIAYSNEHYTLERLNRLNEIISDMLIKQYDLPAENVKNFFGKHLGYATPKVAIRGAVFQEQKILLVKETTDNLWSLPGGWADINLTPTENIEKEILEETGYITKVKQLIGVFDNRFHGHKKTKNHTYALFFLCDLIGGTPQISYETCAVEFFERNKLPPLSLGRITSEEIDWCFEYYHKQILKPFCD